MIRLANVFAVDEATLKLLDLLKASMENRYGKSLDLEFATALSPRGCSGSSCTGTCAGGCLHTCSAGCQQSPFGLF